MLGSFCKEITAGNCNRSHLTVGSGFCLTTVHLFLDLVRQVQAELAASPHEKLSASRWIATRRLGSFLASAEATVSEHFSTLTQNITIIESKFLQCQAQNNGVVVCIATFKVHTRGCHGHDAVQMQAEDLLSTVTRLR